MDGCAATVAMTAAAQRRSMHGKVGDLQVLTAIASALD